MYENKTYEEIKAGILTPIKGIDKREGSFISDMISPIALEFESNYLQFEKMLGIMFLSDTQGEYLDKRANEYGVMRKAGSKSLGSVTFTGVFSTIIPKGSLVSSITNILFETIEDAVIGVDATRVDVGIISIDIGTKGNVSAEEIIKIPVSILGVTAVSNTTSTAGATDRENDEELVKRVLFLLQNPSTSGNINHYKLWSMEVNGIGDAKIFPLYSGNGTVMIMPITSEKTKPDDTLIANVLSHINLKRPIGASVSVNPPTEVLINVVASLSIGDGYTLEDIKKSFLSIFEKYIKESVFKIYNVDYFKCLSFFYDIPGVVQVVSFSLNSGNENISIQVEEIQAVGDVLISV